jgi:competence protein ComFC
MPKTRFSKKGKLIMVKLYHYLEKILSPKFCLNCFNYNSNYVCKLCVKNLKFELNFNCFECGQKVVDCCPQKAHRSLIKFLISFSDYENEFLRRLIIFGKNGAFEVFNDFGDLIRDFLKNYNFKDFYLTPVPLRKRKLLTRGFNQAEVLVKTISRNLGVKIFLGLEKIKETEDQVGLSFEERLTNLKNAFQVKAIPPKKIILVDDIKTTGATLRECARVLKKAGAKEIIALTILR